MNIPVAVTKMMNTCLLLTKIMNIYINLAKYHEHLCTLNTKTLTLVCI